MSVREEYETALAKNEDCVAGIPRSAHHLPCKRYGNLETVAKTTDAQIIRALLLLVLVCLHPLHPTAGS